MRHIRAGREMKLQNALTFMANERVLMEQAFAGDIIGDHMYRAATGLPAMPSQKGKPCTLRASRHFSPELFRAARGIRSKPNNFKKVCKS